MKNLVFNELSCQDIPILSPGDSPETEQSNEKAVPSPALYSYEKEKKKEKEPFKNTLYLNP